MAAETAANPQQSGMGTSSIHACVFGSGAGATVTAVAGFSIAGKSISGCVFFICTGDFAGGSGSTVIRAVSFFGVVTGAGIAAALARIGEGESTGAGGGFVGGRVGN